MLFRGIASIAYRRNVTLPDVLGTALSICSSMPWIKSYRQPMCMPLAHSTVVSSRLKLCAACNPIAASPQVRCTATKASKGAAQFMCNSCGNTSYHYFGRCPMCQEFETCAPSFEIDTPEQGSLLPYYLHGCIQYTTSAPTQP